MKVMEAEGRRIVAVCDRELLGQVFEEEGAEGGRILDLEANRAFYEGELSEREAVLTALANADSVNLVGEMAVGLGKEAGLIEEDNVLSIGGVPHAQAYKMSV